MHLHEEYIKRNNLKCNCFLRNKKNFLFLEKSNFDLIVFSQDYSQKPFLYKFNFYKKGEIKKSLDITWENYERFIFFIFKLYKKNIVFEKHKIVFYTWILFILKNQHYFLNNVDRKILVKSLSNAKSSLSFINCTLNQEGAIIWRKNLDFILKHYAFWIKMLS